MKLRTLSIQLFCIAIFALGCKKNEEESKLAFFNISGYVLDSITGKPLEGIEVVLHRQGNIKSLGFSRDTGFRYTAVTNHEGRYSMTCVYDRGYCDLHVRPTLQFQSNYEQKDSIRPNRGFYTFNQPYKYKFISSVFNTKPTDTNHFSLNFLLVPYTFFTIEIINPGADDLRMISYSNSLGQHGVFRDSVENRLGTIWGLPVSYDRLLYPSYKYLTFKHEGVVSDVEYTIDYERRTPPNPQAPLIKGTYSTELGKVVYKKIVIP